MGMIWFERYEILEMSGEGGFGQVFAALDLSLGRKVALKIVKDPGRAFEQETELLYSLHHPALPVLYDAFRQDDVGVIVMEYLEGKNGKEYVQQYGRATPALVGSWGRTLGELLDCLHSRRPPILYRDLKPENVIIGEDGQIRVIDLGAACYLNGEADQKHRRVGTSFYAAPEQWSGKGCDERSDLYSLGALLYQLLAGRTTQTRLQDAELERLPDGMREIIRKLLQAEPDKRYPSAKAFCRDWTQYQKVGRRFRRKLIAIRIIQLGSLLLAAVGIWLLPEKMIFWWLLLLLWIVTRTYGKCREMRENWWFQQKSVWRREG